MTNLHFCKIFVIDFRWLTFCTRIKRRCQRAKFVRNWPRFVNTLYFLYWFVTICKFHWLVLVGYGFCYFLRKWGGWRTLTSSISIWLCQKFGDFVWDVQDDIGLRVCIRLPMSVRRREKCGIRSHLWHPWPRQEVRAQISTRSGTKFLYNNNTHFQTS